MSIVGEGRLTGSRNIPIVASPQNSPATGSTRPLTVTICRLPILAFPSRLSQGAVSKPVDCPRALAKHVDRQLAQGIVITAIAFTASKWPDEVCYAHGRACEYFRASRRLAERIRVLSFSRCWPLVRPCSFHQVIISLDTLDHACRRKWRQISWK